MKKLLGFLGIFSLVLALFLLLTGQFPFSRSEGDGDRGETADRENAAGPDEELGTAFDYPHYDPEKGRLEWKLEGYVAGDADSIQMGSDRPESLSVRLRRGRARVLLYPNDAAIEPGVKIGTTTVREFLLEFEDARADVAGGRLVSVAMPRGGTGRMDDGTYLEFEELELLAGEGRSEWKAVCDKRARIRNRAVEVHGENGFVARIDSREGLRQIEFRPPVRTFFLPGADLLPFAVSIPRERGGEETSGPYVCVRCQGPLVLLGPERTIRYTRRVELFPVERREEGLLEKLPPTHFRCGTLTLHVDLQARALLGALAERGPNTPVQGFRADAQGDYNVEGDRLVWERGSEGAPVARELHGVTTLSGNPRMWGRDWEVAARRIRLDLDKGAGAFEERVRGWFRSPEFEASRPAPPGLRPPRLWDFQAQRATAEFRRSDPDVPHRLVLERIVAYGAEDADGGGIEIRSRDKIPLIGYGPLLRCTFRDRRIDSITMPRSLYLRPQFSHGRSHIAADKVVLLGEEGHAILEGDVRASIDARWPGEGAIDPASGLLYHEIRAEKLSVNRVVGGSGGEEHLEVRAWGGPDRDLSMKVSGSPIFRLYGETLNWNQATRTATLSGESRPQRLEFYHGQVRAHRLHFDHARRTARADGDVVILLRERPEDEALRVTAAHVELDLHRADVASGGPSDPSSPWAAPSGAMASVPAGSAVSAARAGGTGTPPAARLQSQLAQVRSATAWVDDPERESTLVEGGGFRGRSERLAWDGVKRVLRFTGRGAQSLVFEGPGGRRDEIQAAEILCDWAANRVIFSGKVRGLLFLEDYAGAGRDRRPGGGGGARRGFPLAYQADLVELELRPRGSRYELVRLLASRHVQLENQAYRLKLTGDRLRYETERRLVVIDSPPGDTFPILKREAPEPCDVMAREIRVWRMGTGDALSPSSSSRLAVAFDRDVAMYMTFDATPPTPSSGAWTPRRLRVTTDRLTLVLDPSRGASPDRFLTEARAMGNVSFSTGKYHGSADRAVYDGRRRELAILGSGPTKASVHVPPPLGGVQEAPVFLLRNLGSRRLEISTPKGGYEWKDLELPWEVDRPRIVPSAGPARVP